MELKQILIETIEKMRMIREDLLNSNENNSIIILYIDLFSKIAIAAQSLQNEKLDLDEFNEKLSQLVSSLENQDFDLFGDLIEYEVRPLLEYWYSVI
ncbi:hypothetical protein PAENIP36_01160 [Paenibacillus sp. P36]